MDQRCGLESIASRLVCQLTSGHQPQFRIDLFRESGQGGLVTTAPGFQ
jgi:hypothetical protein